MRPIFVTGIGTEVGKTVVSAILIEALGADYWKPIQAGGLEESDTDRVRRLVTNKLSFFHPETVRLRAPASPHAAAKLEGRRIALDELRLPPTFHGRPLVIEGAGGVLVPLNDRDSMIDLIQKLGCEAVVVSRNYLGSINHSLLTIEALERRGIEILGLVFNGEENAETETAILARSKAPLLGRVRWEASLTAEVIRCYADAFAPALARHGRPRVVGT
ncbi:MAG: dethiobiotin synthase, partial [Vicinamibacteria bacterium]